MILKAANVVIFLVYLLLASAGPAHAAEAGLLWRVESQYQYVRPSYLFGTIHSENPQVLDAAQEVVPLVEDARVFVMELEPRPETVEALSRRMHFRDGRNLRNLVGRALFDKAVEAMSDYGVPEGLVIKMKPWAVVMTLSVPPPKTGLFLDMALYMAALRHEVPVVGLETVDEQLRFFDTLSDRQQLILLEETLESREELRQSFAELLGAYLDGDLKGMERLNERYLGETSPDIAELFRSQLLDTRNARMLEGILPVLRNGNAFIAVGALHLPGDTGLIQGLRDRGYRVSVVR